jgi:Peptidase family M28
VSWPLYRLLLLLALIPPLAAALSVHTPELPPPPPRPIPFDGRSAANLAAGLLDLPGARHRLPGSDADIAAADWIAARFRRYGLHTTQKPFAADVVWRRRPVPMVNVMGLKRGRQHQIVAVVAHRDAAAGQSVETAASTGIMLELAREFAQTAPQRGLLFVSTDGGTTGGQGAAALADGVLARRVVAAIVLDDVPARAGSQLRILTRSDAPRGTSPTLFAAVRQSIVQQTGRPASLPGFYDQLLGYAYPYTRGEQGPLLARGIPSLGVTGDGGLPGRGFAALRAAAVGKTGLALANAVSTLEAAPAIEPGGGPVLFLSGKVVRGWLVQLSFLALLVPFLVGVLEMAGRLRRRRVPLLPALEAYGWRAATALVALAVLWLLTVVPGRLLSGVGVAPEAGRTGAGPTAIALAAALTLAFWRFVARPRLVPLESLTGAERSAGLAAGLLGLGAAAVILVAVNPFSLIVLLPAAHAWLWLPVAARAGRPALVAAYLIGYAGLLGLLLELALPLGLGRDAVPAAVAMIASGYLSPAISVCLALAAAAAAQLGTLIAGRYSPAHARV